MTTTASSTAYMSLSTSSIMYIIIDNQAAFEAIPGPEMKAPQGQTAKCRVKSGEWNGVDVIFQFWGGK